MLPHGCITSLLFPLSSTALFDSLFFVCFVYVWFVCVCFELVVCLLCSFVSLLRMPPAGHMMYTVNIISKGGETQSLDS